VERITDYALGEAIANRFGLWGPLQGERLLDFFEHLVTAHDAYHEALTDPVRILRDIHRPPIGPDGPALAHDACVTLLRQHRSVDAVMAATELTWDEFQRAFAGTVRTDSLFFQLSYDGWRAIESWLLSHPACSMAQLAREFGLTDYYSAQFFHLYAVSDHRPEPASRMGGNKLTPEQRDAMREMIREGLGGTEIASRLKQEFGVTISRALVTKTRQRMDAKGEL
jgi:hypothetical protein